MEQLTLNFELALPARPPEQPRSNATPDTPRRASTRRRAVPQVAAEGRAPAAAPSLAHVAALNPTSEPVPSVQSEPTRPMTVAEVMVRLAALDGIGEHRRRNMISALRRVSRFAGKPPEEIAASATALREVFRNSSPMAAGVSVGRWHNLRCLSLDALHRVGLPALQNRAHVSLSLGWDALRDRLPHVGFRAGLSRFMGWCSAAGIEPERVTQEVFDSYAAALRDGSIRVDPKQAFRTTCILWNRAASEIAGWPALPVPVPSHSRRYALEWHDFPASFQEDVEAFLTRSRIQDPFADDYAKPVKPSTVEHRRKQIRQMATALAMSGFKRDSIRSLATLVEPGNAERLLRVLYDRHRERSTYLHQQATLLRTIARHWVRAPAEQVAKVAGFTRNLAVKRLFMTDKNRERLRQFDNPANLWALLNLPRRLVADVQGGDWQKHADAVRAMLAVAVELLIAAPMRIDCLVGLMPDRHLVAVRRGKTAVTHLLVPAELTKTGFPLEVELPPETVTLLQLYRDTYRQRLTGLPGPYLFPNGAGTRRHTTSMSVAIKSSSSGRPD